MVAETSHLSHFLQWNPVNDSVDQAAVVLSAVGFQGFHAQATALKP